MVPDLLSEPPAAEVLTALRSGRLLIVGENAGQGLCALLHDFARDIARCALVTYAGDSAFRGTLDTTAKLRPVSPWLMVHDLSIIADH